MARAHKKHNISRAGRKKLRQAGKNGSPEDKAKAGRIGYQKMIESVAKTIVVAPSPEPTPEPVKITQLDVVATEGCKVSTEITKLV